MANSDSVRVSPSPQWVERRYADIRLLPGQRKLYVAGKLAALGSRAFDVLIALAEAEGRLVTKDELMRVVWGRLRVEPANLPVHVNAIRRVLGHDAISTVPGRGYRLALAPALVTTPASCQPHLKGDPLPRPITSFVGRAIDCAEIRRLLGTFRLVTLVGMGGVGKTRLALRVADEVADEYEGGVWFAELGALTDPQLVPHRVATAFHVDFNASSSLALAIARRVENRKTLLVIDNCEHVLLAVSTFSRRLLEVAPRLSLLLTSREPTRVRGERTYVVPPLEVPHSSASHGPRNDVECESVRLFRDRAMATSARSLDNAADSSTIQEICRLLEGVPLAIELAAAWLGTLSPRDLQSRLADRLEILTLGDPTDLPHQQSLRASLDWSIDRLPSAESLLLTRLAIFADGWTLDAAEAICVGGLISHSGVLALLNRLVAKSLVFVTSKEGRYRMLEVVRQYALERLKQLPNWSSLALRHQQYFVAFAETAGPQLSGPHQRKWLRRMDAEHSNLVAALRWTDTTSGISEINLRFIPAMKEYWIHRGLVEYGYEATTELLASINVDARSMAACRALAGAGWLAVYRGQYFQASHHYRASLRIARNLGDRKRITSVLIGVGAAAMGRGQVAVAKRALSEALATAKEIQNNTYLAEALVGLGELSRLTRDFISARSYYQEALHCTKLTGDRAREAQVRAELAVVSLDLSSNVDSGSFLREAAMISDELESPLIRLKVLRVASGMAASWKDWEHAALFAEAGERLGTQTGLQRSAADALFLRPLLHEAVSRLSGRAVELQLLAEDSGQYLAVLPAIERWLGGAGAQRTRGSASRTGEGRRRHKPRSHC